VGGLTAEYWGAGAIVLACQGIGTGITAGARRRTAKAIDAVAVGTLCIGVAVGASSLDVEPPLPPVAVGTSKEEVVAPLPPVAMGTSGEEVVPPLPPVAIGTSNEEVVPPLPPVAMGTSNEEVEPPFPPVATGPSSEEVVPPLPPVAMGPSSEEVEPPLPLGRSVLPSIEAAGLVSVPSGLPSSCGVPGTQVPAVVEQK
jgi:hypothetical protein